MVHEEELPKHSWRVTLLRRAANRVPKLNETFSPVAFGSVPNFPLDETRLFRSCLRALCTVFLSGLKGNQSHPSPRRVAAPPAFGEEGPSHKKLMGLNRLWCQPTID